MSNYCPDCAYAASRQNVLTGGLTGDPEPPAAPALTDRDRLAFMRRNALSPRRFVVRPPPSTVPVAPVLSDAERTSIYRRMALGPRASFRTFGPAKPADYDPEYSAVAYGPVARPDDYKSIKRQPFGPAKPDDYDYASPMPLGPEMRPKGYKSIKRQPFGPAKPDDYDYVSPTPLGPMMRPVGFQSIRSEPAYVAARQSAQQRAVNAFGPDRGRVRIFNAASTVPVFVRVVRVTEDWRCTDTTCHRAAVGPDSATYRIPAGATGNIEYRPFTFRERLTPGLVQRVYWSVRPFPPTGPFLGGPNEQLISGTTLFTVGVDAP